MRAEILAVGVVLLVIGFPLYSYGITVLRGYHLSSTLHDLHIFFQSLVGETQLETIVKIAYLSEIVGGILCIIGIFTVLTGLAAKPKEKKPPPP
jgi:uncharacterized membrane protein YphA (DoxX/SURF4 family)